MFVPHRRLSVTALRAIVEEFVTRDGTDHSLVERRVETVLQQLESGVVAVDFDQNSNTCNIILNIHRESDKWQKASLSDSQTKDSALSTPGATRTCSFIRQVSRELATINSKKGNESHTRWDKVRKGQKPKMSRRCNRAIHSSIKRRSPNGFNAYSRPRINSGRCSPLS